MSDKKTLLAHLEELRGRLFICMLFLIVFSLFGYLIHDELILIINAPISTSLIYTSPAGALDFILKISVIFGFLLTTPVLIFETIAFIKPALPKDLSTRRIVTLIFCSFILLFCGIGFAYFLVLPSALGFLSTFSSSELTALISTDSYLDFVIWYLVGFGLSFQLPLVMSFVNYIYKVEAKALYKGFKYIILVSFILAAILTPTPDVVNQLLMALPVITIYILSAVVISITNSKMKK